MDLQIISDLHLNTQLSGNDTSMPTLQAQLWMPTPSAEVLIITGDIWEGDKPLKYGIHHFSWIANVSKLYQKVFILLGNHDYYGSYPDRMVQKWQQHLTAQALHNVILLNNNSYALTPDLLIFGGTGWSDIKRTPASQMAYYQMKNAYHKYYFTDFGEIKKDNTRKIHPSDWQKWHNDYIQALTTHLAQHTQGTTIVASHMPLVVQSLSNTIPCSDHYPVDVANHLDASDYVDLLKKYDVPLHIHGHIHQGLDYTVQHDTQHNTRVICNPLGYAGDISKGKDPKAILAFNPTGVVQL